MDDPWKQWAKWKKPDTKGQNCMICEGWGENEEWLINGVRNFFSEYKQFLNLASGNDLNKYTNILKRSEWWIQWYVNYVKTKLFFFFLILMWFLDPFSTTCASPVARLVKNPPAMQETPVWFLGQEDVLEKE